MKVKVKVKVKVKKENCHLLITAVVPTGAVIKRRAGAEPCQAKINIGLVEPAVAFWRAKLC